MNNITSNMETVRSEPAPLIPLKLDPLTIPLTGTRVIEASAGTGKTWTLAALYVRFILGHGRQGNDFSGGLYPPQILVMTFTEQPPQNCAVAFVSVWPKRRSYSETPMPTLRWGTIFCEIFAWSLPPING